MPRVVLAGNNLAAVYTLDLLLEALTPRDLLAIAPHPTDRPEWQESLATRAGSRRVACLEPEDVNEPEVTSRVLEHDPDLVLSVYYIQLFRGELLTAIAGRALNFHRPSFPDTAATLP